MQLRLKAAAGLAALTLLLAPIATACGGDSSASGTQADTPATTDQTCFTSLDSDQKSQLVDYVNGQADSQVQSTTDNPDGTQDICVLESDGQGGYNQRYYSQNDGFSDYYLYAAMFGRSNSLMTYGLISGDLDAGDYLALSLLTGVNSSGSLYHPYGYTDAGWGRSNTVVSNTRITNVYYGNTNAGSYEQVKNKKPPAGYAPVPIKPNTDAKASVTTGSDGKPVVAAVAAAGAAAALSTAHPATPTPLKPAAATSVPNPNAPKTSAAATTAPAAPSAAATTAPKPTTAAVAPTTPPKVTSVAPTPPKPASTAPKAPTQAPSPPKVNAPKPNPPKPPKPPKKR